jgi:hypothetical protein
MREHARAASHALACLEQKAVFTHSEQRQRHLEDVPMKLFALSALLIAGAAPLLGGRPAMAATSQYTVTVDNGPHAGKYAAKADDIKCYYSKGQEVLFATFSNMDVRTSGVQSGIMVHKPDGPGAKTGDLSLAFGTMVKNTGKYEVTKVPITLTIKGDVADIAGAGKTVDGVQIHISATCANLQM